jgi:DNA-binding response OmpR family regulator
MENIKVLIIDDDPTICSLLETILSMENYQTASANDIDKKEGIIPLLEKESPQLLILDFHLRSQETVNYVPDIRADEKWKDLLVLMTSAIDCRTVCLAAGASEFILKPFNWQQFVSVVKGIIGKL